MYPDEQTGPQDEGTRWAGCLRCAVAFGALGALDLTLALIEANHFRLFDADTPILFAWLLLLVGVPATVFFLLIGVLVQARPAGADPVVAAATVVLAVLFLGGAAVTVTEPASGAVFLRQHLLMALFLCGLIVWRVRPDTQRPRTLALAWVASLLLAGGLSAWGGHPRVLVGSAEPTSLQPPHSTPSGRLVLVGIDGLCWKTLERFGQARPSEDYEWLRRHGSMGPLRTILPTDSPQVWATVATGLRPDQHGILSFTQRRIPGMRQAIQVLPRFQGAFAWTDALESLGFAVPRPIDGRQLRRPPFWEIVGSSGREVHVVGWWATWPAGPLPGTLVSDRFYASREREWNREAPEAHLTWPPDEGRRLRPLLRDPRSLGSEAFRRFTDMDAERIAREIRKPYRHHAAASELPHAYAMDETYFDIAERRLEQAGDDAVFAFYFGGLDLVSHSALRYSALYEEPLGEAAAYAPLVERYYAYVLSRLRGLIEKAGEGARVIVVSDHGFERDARGRFVHLEAPPGVWFVAGPPGLAPETPPSVLDIGPTALWLAGWPVADEMPGRPLRELFPDVAVEGESYARCGSYGLR